MYTNTHEHLYTHNDLKSSVKILSVLSDWLGPQQDRLPPSDYFSESKLQAWTNFTDSLEDALKSVRKEFHPLFKNLQRSISGRILGKISETSTDQTRAYLSPEKIQDREQHKENPAVTHA